MSNIGIVPWIREQYEDRVFDVNPPINRDHLIEPYVEMKREFEVHGHRVHTIDMYDSFYDIDIFLLFTLDWDIYNEILRYGKGNRVVYCTAEPPSVHRYNSPAGYKLLKHIFPYILTWNDDWIDGKSVFKRNYPYWFEDQRKGNLPYGEKKLITCISGNKYSDYPGELYSERRRAIEFLEQSHPNDFDFYGTGWDAKQHICYKGKVVDKSTIYHNYRFAICYENIEGLKGYITEKILDCLVSGVVPIYAGSVNITAYIPDTCFIRFRDFSSYTELFNYISEMDEKTYYDYLKSADEYLKSPGVDCFSGSQYAKCILEAVSNAKEGFKPSKLAYRIFKCKYSNR